MLEIITFMYVLCIWTHMNCSEHTKYFISSLHSSGLLHTILYFFINLASVCFNHPKPVSRGSLRGVLITATNTITASNLSHYTSHQDNRKWKILFTMWGDQSIGYWYRKTSQFPACCRNSGNEIREEKFMEMYLGDKGRRHSSVETSRSSLNTCGGRESSGHWYQETSHYTPSNHRGHGRR